MNPSLVRKRYMRRLNTLANRRTMGGQAMVLGLVMLLVLCVGTIILFDTGQTVNKKVQLVNAADAAAYSVAVQQARALNFVAYTNRARVANEVAIAQLIGLYSWMNQMHTTTIVFEKTMNVLSAIPYVGAVFKALATVFKAAGQGLKIARRTFHATVQNVALPALDGLNGALARSATAVLDGVARVDGVLVAREVVRRNAPDADLSGVGSGVLTSQLLTAKRSFIDTHRIPRSRNGGATQGSATDRASADRFRNVVMQSRDPFSKDRGNHDWNLFLIKFNQSGGTDMVDYNRWAAADTLGLEVNLPFLSDIEAPLGWGGAQAVKRYQQQAFMPGFDNGYGWVSEFENNRRFRPYGDIRRENRIPSSFVDGDPNVALDGGKKQGAYFTGYDGLRDYYDVKPNHALTPYTEPGSRDDPGKATGPIFTVHVETDVANARTSAAIDGIGGPAGSPMAMEDRAANGKIAALASGQVYFSRPSNYSLFQRKDGRVEVGNLFSPYWQARLVDTPTSVELLLGITRL